MKLEKEDEMLGAVAISLFERGKGECPADEEFAMYMDGKLNRERRKTIISHLISCQGCRERLAVSNLAFEPPQGESVVGKLWAFLGRPLIMAPVAIVFLVLAAITLNVYIKSHDAPVTDEIYRGGDLVSVNQIDLTPSLLRIIKEGNQEDLKNNLLKELPTGSEVSSIVLDDKLKSLNNAQKNDKVILIFYSNGLLSVKLGQQ